MIADPRDDIHSSICSGVKCWEKCSRFEAGAKATNIACLEVETHGVQSEEGFLQARRCHSSVELSLSCWF